MSCFHPRTPLQSNMWGFCCKRRNDSSRPFHTAGGSELQGPRGPGCSVSTRPLEPVSGTRVPGGHRQHPGQMHPDLPWGEAAGCTTSAVTHPHLSAVPEKWPQVEDSREMHAFLPSRVCLPYSTVPVVGPRSDQCCDLIPGCQLSVRLWAQPGQPSPEPQQPAGAHGCPPRSPGPRAGLPALCQQEAEPLWVHQHHCPRALLPGGWV